MRNCATIILAMLFSVTIYPQEANDDILNHDLELWDNPSSHIGITIDYTDTVVCVFDGATIRTHPIIAVEYDGKYCQILIYKDERLATLKIKNLGNRKGVYWDAKGKRHKVVKLQ
jgi:hypothetical protein